MLPSVTTHTLNEWTVRRTQGASVFSPRVMLRSSSVRSSAVAPSALYSLLLVDTR